MKRILTLIALLYTFSVSAQFNYPTAAPAWFYRARSAAPTMDTTDYSAVIYPGLLQFRQQPGDTGYYVSNGLRYVRIGADDTFVTGTAGTDFSISSNGSVHTFNMPDASVAARGLVTTGFQTFAGSKVFSNGMSIQLVANQAAAATKYMTLNGDVVNYRTPAQLLSDIKAAPATGSTSYIWNGTTSQTADFNITGTGNLGGALTVAGNVGIGTTIPEQKLHVIGSFITGNDAGAFNGRLLVQPTVNGVNITGQGHNGTNWDNGGLYLTGSSIGLWASTVSVTGDFSTANVSADNISVGIANTNGTGFMAGNLTTYPISNAGNEITVTLPSASTVPGRLYLFPIELGEGGAGLPVTIGGQSVVLGSGTKGPLAIVQSNGTTWIYLQGF